MTDRVIAVLKKFEKVDANKVSPTAHFYNDLGLDSLDAVEVRGNLCCPPFLATTLAALRVGTNADVTRASA